jgi:undecaprenyl-diphosphatase
MKISKKLLIISMFCLAVFLLILLQVLSGGFLTRGDISVNSFMPGIRNQFFTGFTKIIDVVFGTWSMVIISFILSAIIFFRHSKKDAVFFASAMLLSALLIYAVKEIVRRPRPINAIIATNDFAFPTGHTTSAVMFFGLLAYLAYKKSKSSRLKATAIAGSMFMVLLIAFTRLYANVHWLSDVLGGLAMGAFMLTISIIIYDYLGKPSV